MMWKSAIVLFACIACIASLMAVAAEKSVETSNSFTNEVGPAKKPEPKSEPSTVKVSAEDCARMVEHQPRADVAYKPGVDVHGDPVAPADVSGQYSAIKAPSKVEFDIAFNPLHAALANRLSETSLSLGRVSYDINSGEMTYNGKSLSDPDKVLLSKRCREKLSQNK